ncbi:hypothetical protein AB0C81_26935 [Streptomyces roseoverticillatus]|uniref:hypothetical protein n=1 Tax=Streptomyces roseoverticillatus TaxID=66429 RepID=UPI0033BFFADB
MTTLEPTVEQAAAVDAFATGTDLVLQAGAGTGKTSTLQMLAASDTQRRGVYVKEALTTLAAVSQSLTKDVLDRAAAVPAHAGRYE